MVIGTEATVSSHAYAKALQARGIEATEKACPLLVPLVEEGWAEHPVAEQVARIYLDEAFAGDFESADVLVLGCTHYPLLKPLLQRLVPQPCDDRGFRGLHRPVVSQLLRQETTEDFFRKRTPQNASTEILRHRFSGEIPTAGSAISGQSDREMSSTWT